MAAPVRVGEHGLVLWASIAGLLAARVLSDHFGRVTVVERDLLPEGPEHRRGVPQDRHPHLLQAGGAQRLEDLFAGMLDELEAAGSAVVTEAQYASREWLDALEHAGAKPSMGGVGVCWDCINAPAEAWFAGFKVELVHPLGAFTTRHEARVEIANYIRWHNRTRAPFGAGLSRSPHQWERIVTLTRAA